jgi:hypothetical protein
MSPKQLARLAGVLVIAIALWGILALTHRQSGGDRSSGFTLPKIDTVAVDTIALAGAHDTAILVRTSGAWRVNGNPAAAAPVSQLLKALRDTTAWTELAAEHANSHARLGVTRDSGEHVRVVSHGHALLDVIAGKQTPDYGGLYVRRPTEDAVYALHGELANALHHSADDWRDKLIVAVPSDSVDTIAVQRGTRAYSLKRAGKSWTLGGGTADSAAVADLLSQYRNLAATGFATAAQSDSLHFKPPRRQVRLIGKSGRPLAHLVFDSTTSGVWARADSGGPVFHLDSWTAAKLLPADSTLRAKKTK